MHINACYNKSGRNTFDALILTNIYISVARSLWLILTSLYPPKETDTVNDKKYSNRSNARRAGMTTGLCSENIEITAHKSHEGTKFGWREKTQKLLINEERNNSDIHRCKITKDVCNGIKRPKSEGACKAVWDWLDSNPNTPVSELRIVASNKKWNSNNAVCEYYCWRKYMGKSGKFKQQQNHK